MRSVCNISNVVKLKRFLKSTVDIRGIKETEGNLEPIGETGGTDKNLVLKLEGKGQF